MPYIVRQIARKWRVIEKSTGKVGTNSSGSPIDGGGHESRDKALRQAQAVNISEARSRGAKIPKRR